MPKQRTHSLHIGLGETIKYKGFGPQLVPPPPVLGLLHYRNGRSEVWGLDDADAAISEFLRFVADMRERGVNSTAIFYEMGTTP